MICKVCDKNVTRDISSRKRPDGSTRFLDAEGRLWNGRTCPTCFYKKKNNSLIRSGCGEGPSKPLFYKPPNKCPRCDNMTYNKYMCSDCHTHEENRFMVGDEVYFA